MTGMAQQLIQVEGMASQVKQAMKSAQKKLNENDFWVSQQAASLLKYASWGVAALLAATAVGTVAAAPVLALAGAAAGASIATAGTMLDRAAAERAEMRAQAQTLLNGCKVVMRELHDAYQEIKREARMESQSGYTPSADLIRYQERRQQQTLELESQQDAGISYGQGEEASIRHRGPTFG